MSQLAFPLPPVTLPIAGSDQLFPVSRVFCVGRNYAAHTREMGGDPEREAPIFFMKPASAVTTAAEIPFPADTESLHHEVELVVAIGPGRSIFGYAVGVDLTKRDRQAELRGAGSPWERAKSFPRAAPISAITPASAARSPNAARITLSVNGVTKQDSTTEQLIWNIGEIIERLTALWELDAGDLIYTGTPEGVGPLLRGEKIEASVEGIAAFAFTLK